MAPSIWTVEERPLLAHYLAQYRASDEESRILLLENTVIPTFLATFPPGQADSDGDDIAHDGIDLREAERRLRQKIHNWFIKKTPLNISSTPRRKPRAATRGDPEVREVLKHYIELYRVGTEQSRKILITTRVLPDFVRQFLSYGDVNKLSKEQRNYYKKSVRDWLTVEAYYRAEGEQDPEHGLHLSLDAVSDSNSDEWSPDSPTPSVRRKRVISPSQDEPLSAKRRRTLIGINTRVPVSPPPSSEGRSSPTVTSRRRMLRTLPSSYDSTAPPSPPQTPRPKAQTRGYNSRYVVFSASPSPEPEEPALDAASEPEIDEGPFTRRSQVQYVVHSAPPSPEAEDGSELDLEAEDDDELEGQTTPVFDLEDDLDAELEYPPEPEVTTDLRSRSSLHERTYSLIPNPQQQTDQDAEDGDDVDQDEDDEDEELLLLQEGETVMQEPDGDAVMQDEEYYSDEEGLPQRERELQQELEGLREEAMAHVEATGGQDSELEYEDEERQQQPSEDTLSKRPDTAARPIHLTEPEEDSRPFGEDTPPVRSIRQPPASKPRHGITATNSPSLEDVLTNAIAPLFGQHSFTEITNTLEKVMIAQRDTNAPARVVLAKNGGRDQDNECDQEHSTAPSTAKRKDTEPKTWKFDRKIVSQLAQGIEDLKKSTDDSRKLSESWHQEVRVDLGKLRTLSHAVLSQTVLHKKKVRELYESLNDTRGRKSKSKPRKSTDSTTTTAAGVTSATSSASPRHPATAEAVKGRFRKAIGASVTVTYYLVKLTGRPLEEAVWRSLEDLAQSPNSAIMLAEFHAEAEAEGLNLSQCKDDYVYLRAAFLAGWDSDGTVHKRT